MATLKIKIQNLIRKANETTGENDLNITDAIIHLCDGYGSSAGHHSISVSTDKNLSVGEYVSRIETGMPFSLAYTVADGYVANVIVKMGGVVQPVGNPIEIASVTSNVEITFSVSLAPTNLTDVPEYWRNDITNAVQYVDGLGSGYVHYLVSTDNHYTVNKRHSAVIQNYLMQTGKFDKLLLLGDIVDSETVADANYQSLISDLFNGMDGDILLTLGNHDINLDKETVYKNDFMSKAPVTWVNGYNWYYDNDDAKLRIIGLDYFIFSADYNPTFLNDIIASIPNGYAYAIVLHVTMKSANEAWTMSVTENTDKNIMSCIEKSDKSFVGFFTGHQHIDETTQLSNKAYHTTFMCDRYENLHYYSYYNYPTRTSDSNSEQAISILSINPTLKSVKIKRIGTAVNSEYSSGWEYTYEDIEGVEEPQGESNDVAWTNGVPYTLVIVDDKYYEKDGTITDYTGWSLTEPVYCKNANCIYLSETMNGNYFALYNENKEYIGNAGNLMVTGPNTYRGWAFNVPSDVCYFGCSDVTGLIHGIIITPYDRPYDTDMDA